MPTLFSDVKSGLRGAKIINYYFGGRVPQLRQNIITGDWVVIAPERAKRPQDFVIPKSIKIAKKVNCPFCVDGDGYKENKKVRLAHHENVYAIENKFPAFISEEDKVSVRSFYPEKGFYRAKPSIGRHEVIVLKEHDTSILKLSKSVAQELLEVIRERYIWMKNQKITSIIPIYNHGAEAGASMDHPHAQIFGSGVIANSVGKEIEGADRYFGINGACVFCDIVKHELHEKIRVVYENSAFLSTTFFASRFPFETWLYPKKHHSQFEEISKNEMAELADCLMETLYKIDKTLENPPLNLYIHTLPTILEDSASFHWHVEIVPRLSNYGGFELGSGVIIDVMSPEEAADYLRSAQTNKRN